MLCLSDVINNKWHSFSFFFRIVDLEVEQNRTREETFPSSGLCLLCLSLIFYYCFLPSPRPLEASLLSSPRVSKTAVKSGDCELCPSKTAGNKSPWKSETWQQLPSTIIFNISSLPQDVIPGCDRRSVLCAHLFPAMNLSTGVVGRKWEWSGNDLRVRCSLADRLHLDVQRLCLTRAVWSELILTSFNIICLAGEDEMWQPYLRYLANML